MNTYSYGYTKRRRFNFKLIFALIALVGGITTVGLAIKVNFSEKKIQQYTTSIKGLEQETKTLEENVPNLSEVLKDLEEQVGHLKDVVGQMKPVVVPDSMK